MPYRFAISVLVLLLAVAGGGCAERALPGSVHVVTVDGAIDQVTPRYLERAIERAEETRASALVVRVDTPGGRADSMRAAVSQLENARVPVITYVGPSGAQAASAGTFLVMAGHVAAMAPNTTIGAATPVTVTGEDIEGAMGQKVTNDLLAFARGLAELRGRNGEWAERAIREGTSASTSEAIELRVVDFAAEDMGALLEQSHGREVRLVGGAELTLATRNAARVETGVNVYERVLRVMTDPLVVGILMLGGLFLIWTELNAPGMFVPGALGVIALIIAMVGLGTLLPEEAAVALIVVGSALILLEIFVPGGILGSIGGLALIVGLGTLLGHGATAIDLRLMLTLLAIFAVTVGLVIGVAVAFVARGYMAPTSRSGTARL